MTIKQNEMCVFTNFTMLIILRHRLLYKCYKPLICGYELIVMMVYFHVYISIWRTECIDNVHVQENYTNMSIEALLLSLTDFR